jgi:hypothetical protein
MPSRMFAVIEKLSANAQPVNSTMIEPISIAKSPSVILRGSVQSRNGRIGESLI